jgi:hypothetical protein
MTKVLPEVAQELSGCRSWGEGGRRVSLAERCHVPPQPVAVLELGKRQPLGLFSGDAPRQQLVVAVVQML